MDEFPTAHLAHCRVRGRRSGDVCRFDAIPYARPPVGDLRFAPPVRAELPDTFEATTPGPVPPQLPSRLREAMGDFDAPQSEDCLHLTVWTPGVDDKRRPVVVWLHGGAWQSGGGALPWYDGAGLAATGDLVVVAINYRLAALGWASLPGASANLGLLDQEAAIAWVVENIAAFGGDPDRITAMGQSAGAGSIVALMARQPRFRRAILQSGPLGRPWQTPEQARAVGAALMQAAGADTLQAARALPVERWLQAQAAPEVQATVKRLGLTSTFGIVADGEVLPAAPDLAALAGRMDTLVGYTLDEMTAFPGMGRDEASAAVGEALFGAPARRWADEAVAAGRRCWSFRFDFGANPSLGACHCIELPFVFGTFDAFGGAAMLAGADRDQARALSRRMQQAWVSFVHGGDPGWQLAPVQHCFH